MNIVNEKMIKLIEKYAENEEYIDFTLGIKTGIDEVDNQSWKHKRWYGYQPCEYRILWNIFKKYPFSKNDVLVDYGAGLGRVIITAVIAGCNKAIGVEVDKESIEILKENVSHLKMNREISIVEQQAENWRIEEGVTRFFFFNPFHMITFLSVLESIITYAKFWQRECIIFFVTLSPGYTDVLNRHKECQLQDIIYDVQGKFDTYVYRVK